VSEPVFGLFEQTGRAIKIDGNRDPDVVFADVEQLIQRVLNHEPLAPPPAEEEEERPSE
jgi:hypothetical protein